MATAALPAGPRGRRGEGAGPAPGRDIPASRRPPAALPLPSRSPSLRGSAEGRPPARPAPGRARPPLATRRRRGGKAAARPTSLQATSPVRRSRRPVLRSEQPVLWLGECCGVGQRRAVLAEPWGRHGNRFPASPGGASPASPAPGERAAGPVPWGALAAPAWPRAPLPDLLAAPSSLRQTKGCCPRGLKRKEKPPSKKIPFCGSSSAAGGGEGL